MDLCHTPLVDARPLHPATLDDQLLGEYDPLVRHQQQLNGSDRISATFGFDHSSKQWTLDDEAVPPGLSSGSSDSSPPRLASASARRTAARITPPTTPPSRIASIASVEDAPATTEADCDPSPPRK